MKTTDREECDRRKLSLATKIVKSSERAKLLMQHRLAKLQVEAFKSAIAAEVANADNEFDKAQIKKEMEQFALEARKNAKEFKENVVPNLDVAVIEYYAEKLTEKELEQILAFITSEVGQKYLVVGGEATLQAFQTCLGADA